MAEPAEVKRETLMVISQRYYSCIIYPLPAVSAKSQPKSVSNLEYVFKIALLVFIEVFLKVLWGKKLAWMKLS